MFRGFISLFLFFCSIFKNHFNIISLFASSKMIWFHLDFDLHHIVYTNFDNDRQSNMSKMLKLLTYVLGLLLPMMNRLLLAEFSLPKKWLLANKQQQWQTLTTRTVCYSKLSIWLKGNAKLNIEQQASGALNRISIMFFVICKMLNLYLIQQQNWTWAERPTE